MTEPLNATRPGLVLAALGAAYFFIGATSLGVIGLVPEMAGGLAVSPAAIGALVTVFAIVYAIAAPVLQAFLGAVQRRTLITVGVLMMALSCFLSAVAQDYWILALSRVGMALGAALAGPTASAAAAALVAPEHRGRALAAVFTGLTVSTVLGVPLASWLGQAVGWRWSWAVMGIMALPVALCVWTLLDPSNRGQRATLSALVGVMRDRALALSISTTAVQLHAQFITYGLLAVWLIEVAGFDRSQIPPLLFLFGISGVAGNALSPMIAGLVGPERAVQFCLGVMSAVVLAMWIAPDISWAVALMLVLWSIAGLMVMAPMQTRLVRLSPERAGLSFALNASAVYVGMSVGSAVGAAVLSTYGPEPLPLLTALFGIAALLVFRAGLERE